ncbi:stage V sporulation protein AD [Clostridium taeniosporum]|uniref:Stage V sporulation protein AD n=1 Tax=Clostridium taeniosporum TaxID=394958 RepID=A0A1D7XHZ0_9CLOT|nr:stage V sporulation protein AD [Clostridium taeniosporum]AOR22964.1 stage V sporulation protein AD [Clostridium taeniosporum]
MKTNNKKIGSQTVKLTNPPKIISSYSVVGPKEGEGPLKEYFDQILNDDTCGKDSFEKAESEMMYTAITQALSRANLQECDIDYLFAGDLLNQIISSSFTARKFEIPFFGLYGACSTMTESLSLASIIMDAGCAEYVIAATSSHFSSAERQFRFPLEYGCQRSATCQWTVTGSGALVLGHEGKFPEVTYVTTGKVKDYGQKDPNNMGAAMAPAAVDTLVSHFKDTGRKPQYYDVIATGDLGSVGKELADKLIAEYGFDIRANHMDCGEAIFNNELQKTAAGGSGCGCSAVVFAGELYKKLMRKEIKNVLLVSTGALMSPTSSLQGESIPGIAHAVSIEMK